MRFLFIAPLLRFHLLKTPDNTRDRESQLGTTLSRSLTSLLVANGDSCSSKMFLILNNNDIIFFSIVRVRSNKDSNDSIYKGQMVQLVLKCTNLPSH